MKAKIIKPARKETFITVFVGQEMKQRLWTIARREGVSLSVVVRSALQFFLEHYEGKADEADLQE